MTYIVIKINNFFVVVSIQNYFRSSWNGLMMTKFLEKVFNTLTLAIQNSQVLCVLVLQSRQSTDWLTDLLSVKEWRKEGRLVSGRVFATIVAQIQWQPASNSFFFA